MHKSIAVHRLAALIIPLVQDAQRVGPIPARLGTSAVGPVGPAPGAARRRVDTTVELACFHSGHPRVLHELVEVVLIAADQDVDLVRVEAETGLLAETLQGIADAGLALDAR